MSSEQTIKALEVKIRTLPSQERSDQKDVARVFFAKEALLDLGLSAGQICRLEKITEDGNGSQSCTVEAIAWPSAQKLNRNVVQIFKTFQATCAFKLEDRFLVTKRGDVEDLDAVCLRQRGELEELEDGDKSHWSWFLEENLSRAETIFVGLTFTVSLRGPRRIFVVASLTSKSSQAALQIGQYTPSTSVQIIRKEESSPAKGPELLQSKLEVVDIPGLDQALEKLNKFLERFSSDGKTTVPGSKKSCAVLLTGSPGTGKSMILKKLATMNWGHWISISAETKTTALQQAFKDARSRKPSIIAIDDIEMLMSTDPNRASGVDRVLGEELDKLMDEQSSGAIPPRILVIATTSASNAVPRRLRKRGRFNTEIILPAPDSSARKAILRYHAQSDSAPSPKRDAMLDALGERTHAYTGEDLAVLWDEACSIAEERLRAARDVEQQQQQQQQRECSDAAEAEADIVVQADIDTALLHVRPTAMHDVTLQPPRVQWEDIGGNEAMKAALRRAIEEPLRNPDRVARLAATPPRGILLYGPPGCSKTLTAQAIATTTAQNFFAVKGAELLNMYVGESERAVRSVFARARAAAPAIIFFDEIESIGARRGGGGGGGGIGGFGGGGGGGVNVLTTLLNEMDGIEALRGVTVLAATNAPRALDLALLRPGRFDELVYVPPPDRAARLAILRIRTRRMDCGAGVRERAGEGEGEGEGEGDHEGGATGKSVLEMVAERTEGFSGAEVVGVCAKAVDSCWRRCEMLGEEVRVGREDFEMALRVVKGRITAEMVRGYEEWAEGVTV